MAQQFETRNSPNPALEIDEKVYSSNVDEVDEVDEVDDGEGFTLAALYCFTSINDDDLEMSERSLKSVCNENKIKGGLIVAKEGINGTIAGKAKGIEAFVAFLKSDPTYADLEIKYSHSHDQPFYRLRTQIKNEIVTLGVEGVDPNHNRGIYIQPEDWNNFISDPNTILLDTRNDYEVAIGSFQGAINPNTKIFREFPDYIQQELPKYTRDDGSLPRIAMFCTGGIRCEKASAYLRNLGYPEVYHLKGGILNYLEKIPQEESLWNGECYVFDQRVSVGHGVLPGTYIQCRSCRMPLSPIEASESSPPPPEYLQNGSNQQHSQQQQQTEGPYFEEGVFCRYCFTKLKRSQIEAARERNKQIQLSKVRHVDHLGYTAEKIRKPQKKKYNYNRSEYQRNKGGGGGGEGEDEEGVVSSLFHVEDS